MGQLCSQVTLRKKYAPLLYKVKTFSINKKKQILPSLFITLKTLPYSYFILSDEKKKKKNLILEALLYEEWLLSRGIGTDKKGIIKIIILGLSILAQKLVHDIPEQTNKKYNW